MKPALTFFACLLFVVACDQELHNPFSHRPTRVTLVVQMYTPIETVDVIKTPKDFDELDAAEQKDAEAKKLFHTAFATESACQGIELLELLPKPGKSATEIKKLPHSLVIVYDSRPPGHWSYNLNYNAEFGAMVDSEHEVAKQVCQIIKRTGGVIGQT